MKKNLIIGLLTLVSVLSLAFGYTQKMRADKQEAIAVKNEKLAKEMAARAEKQTRIAMAQAEAALESRMEAELQLQRAEEALRKIRKK